MAAKKPLNTNFGDTFPPRNLGGTAEAWGRAMETRIKQLERVSEEIGSSVVNTRRTASSMADSLVTRDKVISDLEGEVAERNNEVSERIQLARVRLDEVSGELNDMSDELDARLEGLEQELLDAEQDLDNLRNNVLPGIEQELLDAATDAATAIQVANSAVTSSEIEYAVSSSDTTAPSSGWSTAQPTRTPGTFIWMRTKVTYGSGSTSTTSAALLTGPPGPKGDDGDGVEIAGTVSSYSNLPSNLGPSDAGKAYLVSADGKLYVWDGTSFPANGQGVQFRGPEGDQGVSVSSVIPYYRMAPSQPSQPSGANPTGWSTTEPVYVPGQSLWRSERVAYSNNTYSWTPVTKVEAFTVAANLKDTIDAGLMRVARESDPPTPAKGLTWLVVDEPTGTKAVGLKVANSNGSGWGSYQLLAEDVLVVGPNGTVRLKDGVVSAQHIVASESLSSKVGEFLELKTDQLTVVGSAGVDELVANEIWAEKIKSQKVMANEVWIGGSSNAIPDPTFLEEGSAVSRLATPSVGDEGVSSSTATPGAVLSRYRGSLGAFSGTNITRWFDLLGVDSSAGSSEKDSWVDVGEGESWLLQARIYASGGPINNWRFRVYVLLSDGTTTLLSAPVQTSTSGVHSHAFVMPDFAVRAAPRISVTSSDSTSNFYVYGDGNLRFAKQVDQNLIVDGGILARHMTADSIDGMTITGATLRTAASGARTQITSAGLQVFNSSGQELVRVGHGVDTGMSVRNPHSGSMTPLAPMVFGGVHGEFSNNRTLFKPTGSSAWGDWHISNSLGTISTPTGRLLIFGAVRQTTTSSLWWIVQGMFGVSSGSATGGRNVGGNPDIGTRYWASGNHGTSAASFSGPEAYPNFDIITVPKDTPLYLRMAVRAHGMDDPASAPTPTVDSRRVFALPV